MRNVFLAKEIQFLFTELEIKRRQVTTKMKLSKVSSGKTKITFLLVCD